MSEEVLKALMQLFAIIANQDGGSGAIHYKYVQSFLKSQISDNRITEFLEYYNSFIKSVDDGEDQKKRTSVKDSVRTLAICKKINKTLNQKQKIIVFTRLREFILQEENSSALRSELLKTVADIFNITREESKLIDLVFTENYGEYTSDFLLIESDETGARVCKSILIHDFPGSCIFLYVRETNIIFSIYRGTAELSLNGMTIQPGRINVFSPGSAIRHSTGTVFYSDVINSFLDEHFENKISFHATLTEHHHSNGKTALRELTISENSGTLVGIMGASGSGKTTLLNVLSGIDHVTSGTIRINGIDIHKESKKIKGVIGFIPQDDLLIEELTVYQNLYLNAKLCFRDISDKELGIKVLRLLSSLGLHEAKDIKVGNPLNKKISGGQRKRLNIALELIREPQVLFVDEPTSGLSSRDSENVMDLLKELSHKGKLIFVVIHQPSSDIYKLFDKIFILDTGGFPAFYGNPIDAVLYFKKITNQVNSENAVCQSCGSVNPELIFNLLEAKEIDEYGNYTEKRKILPEGWYQQFSKNFSVPAFSPKELIEKLKTADIPGRFKQWKIFFIRDLLSKISNKQYLLINLLEVPALAFLLSILIRYTNRPNGESVYSYYNNDNIPAYFFMIIIVALLVGLTVSAEEIYKDKKILKRERFLNLSRFSYLTSKIIILFSISAIQSLFLCLVGNLILRIPGNILHEYLMIFSVFCSANLMGLVLSATFNSPVTIYVIIPLVIIPQMLLGGAMFKYSRLNEYLGGSSDKVPVISNFMVARWAYEGIAVNAQRNNKYEKELFAVNKLESELNYRVSYLVPKIEELKDKKIKHDSVLTVREKQFITTLISNTLASEFEVCQRRYGKIEMNAEMDSLGVLKDFLVKKYNFILDRKDKDVDELRKKGILKNSYTNKSLEELVTNALEKNKILIDSSQHRFIQVMDPIYKEPESSKLSLGMNAHFYTSTKKIFNKEMPTFYFNLILVWIFNLFTFLLLYFDVLRKIVAINPFNRNTKK